MKDKSVGWLFTGLGIGLLLAVGTGFGVKLWMEHIAEVEKAAEKKEAEKPAEEEHNAAGKVKITKTQHDNAKIEVEPVAAGSLMPEVALYGAVKEDPGAGFVVRAPIAGTIAVEKKAWPQIGQTLEDNGAIGLVNPRAVPSDLIALATERVTLQTQIAAAQSEVIGAKAAIDAARAAYERLRKLNAEDQNVSERAVEEALAKVKTEEARLQGANQTLELTNKALSAVEMKLEPSPLALLRGGEVIGVTAQPGESVEAGQEILRVAKFDRVLIEVEVPLRIAVPDESKTARIFPYGREKAETKATRVGYAPQNDPSTHSQLILYRVDENKTGLRPGTAITARVPLGGTDLKGIFVPEEAIVRYQGGAWVYVEEKVEEKEFVYERHGVTLDHPMMDANHRQGWLVMSGLEEKDKLVTVGAPLLLSQETLAVSGGGE